MAKPENSKLLEAIASADPVAAMAALAKRADPNAAGDGGETPLHRLAKTAAGGADPAACLEIHAALLRAGADPTIRDEMRRVPSHYWPLEEFRVANLAQAFHLKGDSASLLSLRIGGKSLADWLPGAEAPKLRARTMDGGMSM